MTSRLCASLVVLLSLCGNAAQSQTAASQPPFRLADEGNWGKQQRLIGQLAAEGYVLLIGRPVDNFVIMRRRGETEPAETYKIVESKKDIEKELAKGWRAVPGTVDVNPYGTSAVFARKAADGEVAEVLVLETTRASTLDREILESRTKGFRVVGIASADGGHAAVLERVSGTPGEVTIDPKTYVVAKGGEALQQALTASAAAGYRIEQATAFKEMRVALEPHEGEAPIEYRVLHTTHDQTLSEQVNAAAAEGFVVTPGTLQVAQKGSLLGQSLGSEVHARHAEAHRRNRQGGGTSSSSPGSAAPSGTSSTQPWRKAGPRSLRPSGWINSSL